MRQIQILLQFLFPPRMCFQRAPSSRRTHAPTPQKHPGSFCQSSDAKWSIRFLDRDLFVKDLPGWCKYHGKGEVYAINTIRPAIRDKIPTQCQGLYDAAQKLGKTAYLCDSHVQDPSRV